MDKGLTVPASENVFSTWDAQGGLITHDFVALSTGDVRGDLITHDYVAFSTGAVCGGLITQYYVTYSLDCSDVANESCNCV